MKRSIFLFIVLFAVQCGWSQGTGYWNLPSKSINGLNYFLFEETGEVMVADDNCWEGELVLPATVNWDGQDYPLKYLASRAFADCKTLTRVVIPETVQNIRYYSSYLGERNLIKAPFLGCSQLKSIEVAENNQWLCSVDGVLYNHEKTQLFNYPSGAERSHYVIPEGVDAIGAAAFRGSVNLTSVSFPNTLTQIYEEAFYGCDNMEQISLPDNVSTIRFSTFRDCSKLKTIHLPDNLTEIENAAFYGCSSLKEIVLPEKLQTLGGAVFIDCQLETIVIEGYLYDYSIKNLLQYLDESTTLYVPASEINRYKSLYSGTILSLEDYDTVSSDEGNIYTYFVTNPDGQYETLFLNYDRNVEVDGKNYQQYVGSYLDRSYADPVLLRREEKKYFYYDSRTSEEHLLFDFGLQKGDIFTDDFSGTVYDVVDVRDSLINDSLHRLIEIRDCEGTGKHDIWLEDVGSIYTGILPKNKFKDVCLLIYFQFYYSIEEDVEHSTYFFPNTPQIKTAGMSVTRSQWDKELETEEDRDAYLTWLHAPTDLNAEFENDTLHIWGRLRASCSIQTYAACELSGDNISFMVYPYNNLLDEDCIGTYEVETRIPDFERGTYKVNLYNKTVELECIGYKEPVTFTQDQMATIILPTAPDATKGKYYKLDRVEDGQIIFEQELQPRACVPYIIVPSEDFSIDPSTLALEGLSSDTVSIDGIRFIGTYSRKELNEQEGFYIDIIDTTPDCQALERPVVGALRAWLQVNWDDPIDHGGAKSPEEKKLIVLKDNPDGIEDNEESRLKNEGFNAAVFDLSGRSLPGRPRRGLYIEGNRKTVR